MTLGMKKDTALLQIKIIHTAIWAFFVAAIGYIVYAGVSNRIDFQVWIAIGLVAIEGIILLLNGWKCPLTDMAAQYTEQIDDGFDIFLPNWLARNNKTIFTLVFFVGVSIVVYRLFT